MSYFRNPRKENARKKSIKVEECVPNGAATVEQVEEQSSYNPVYNHIIYVSIGKGTNLVLEQYNFTEQFDMVRALGLMIRRRLNLLDSTMEDYCDPHVYTFKGGINSYKMIDLVCRGFFYCVGSYLETDPKAIESIFEKLVSWVDANFSDFEEMGRVPRCIMRYKQTLSYLLSDFSFEMCKSEMIYSDDNNYRSQVYDSVVPRRVRCYTYHQMVMFIDCKLVSGCLVFLLPNVFILQSLTGEGPAVLYAFIAHGPHIMVEFINWMDGIDKLTELADDVSVYEPWNQKKSLDPRKSWDHVRRLGKDYSTLKRGSYVFFLCSTSISEKDCQIALMELSREFALDLTCDKFIIVPKYFWWIMRNLFVTFIKKVEAQEKDYTLCVERSVTQTQNKVSAVQSILSLKRVIAKKKVSGVQSTSSLKRVAGQKKVSKVQSTSSLDKNSEKKRKVDQSTPSLSKMNRLANDRAESEDKKGISESPFVENIGGSSREPGSG